MKKIIMTVFIGVCFMISIGFIGVFTGLFGGWFTAQGYPYAVYEFETVTVEQLEEKIKKISTKEELRVVETKMGNSESSTFKYLNIYLSNIQYSTTLRYGEGVNKKMHIYPIIEYDGAYDEKNKKFLKAKKHILGFEEDFINKLGLPYKRLK